METLLPLLVFDGDCRFCRRWILRWRKKTGSRVMYRPYQELDGGFPGISNSALEESVHLVEPGGRISHGADAVFRTLEYAEEPPWYLWLRRVPGFMVLARWIYRFVAKHRSLFSRFS